VDFTNDAMISETVWDVHGVPGSYAWDEAIARYEHWVDEAFMSDQDILVLGLLKDNERSF
jgi:hypothetical protein